MRPIMKTTLCAIVAAGVAAPAFTAQSNHYIKLGGVDGGAVADDHKGQIEILSFQWGETRAAGGKYDALTDGLIVVRKSGEKGESAPPAPGGGAKFGAVSGMHRDSGVDADPALSKVAGTPGGTARFNPKEIQVTKKVSWTNHKPQPAGRGTAIGKAIGNHAADGEEAASAPAEKRQHGWVTVPTPRDRGAVRVKVKFPWVGCAVGARYPALTLGGGAQRYELQDAIITSCASDDVSFNYDKVTVRGWNPSTKQE